MDFSEGSLKLFKQIVDTLPDPSYAVDKNRTIIAWNEALANCQIGS